MKTKRERERVCVKLHRNDQMPRNVIQDLRSNTSKYKKVNNNICPGWRMAKTEEGIFKFLPAIAFHFLRGFKHAARGFHVVHRMCLQGSTAYKMNNFE